MDRKESKKLKEFKKLYLPKIVEKYKPKEVILFGSIARGDFLKESDLDIIIVSDRFKDISFVTRASKILRDVDMSIGVDILCYTAEEFNRKKKEICIVSEALKEGVSLLK